jgi:hypothetical protein
MKAFFFGCDSAVLLADFGKVKTSGHSQVPVMISNDTSPFWILVKIHAAKNIGKQLPASGFASLLSEPDTDLTFISHNDAFATPYGRLRLCVLKKIKLFLQKIRGQQENKPQRAQQPRRCRVSPGRVAVYLIILL